MDLAPVKAQRAFYYPAHGKGPHRVNQEQAPIEAHQSKKYFKHRVQKRLNRGAYNTIFCFLLSCGEEQFPTCILMGWTMIRAKPTLISLYSNINYNTDSYVSSLPFPIAVFPPISHSTMTPTHNKSRFSSFSRLFLINIAVAYPS